LSLFIILACIAQPAAFSQTNNASLTLTEMRQAVAQASAPGMHWNGPKFGPTAQMGATISVVCEDLRNGGILGVANGIDEASKVIGWKLRIFDAGGTADGRAKAFANALALKPNGVIIIGADTKENMAQLKQFAGRGIPMVGWHIGATAGSTPDSLVATNVSSDPLEVARITAMAAVVESRGHAKVVVFTDSNFRIAIAKSSAMIDIIKACTGCSLLEVKDIAISKSAESMPDVTKKLLTRYGANWTHALAINDIYFDYAVPELTKAGRASNSISLISAGDGSTAAFLRIQAGTFQTGTVAEPLNLQGWQLIDELNRLLAHQPVTGFVVPVHLVMKNNVAFDGGAQMKYDPDNGYRDIYRHIWKR
jgi:ribose transport system substrate-binding protein